MISNEDHLIVLVFERWIIEIFLGGVGVLG
jgi:hypothetical protein